MHLSGYTGKQNQVENQARVYDNLLQNISDWTIPELRAIYKNTKSKILLHVIPDRSVSLSCTFYIKNTKS